MPKLNKPRTGVHPDREAAQALLAEHQFDPSEVMEVIHFADGSMSIILRRDNALWHECIEFDPALTSQIALAFRAVGVLVERRDT